MQTQCLQPMYLSLMYEIKPGAVADLDIGQGKICSDWSLLLWLMAWLKGRSRSCLAASERADAANENLQSSGVYTT